MAVLPSADITLPPPRGGGGVSLSCPALAREERQAVSFSRKVRANAEQRTPRKKRSPRKTSLQTRREAERREAHQPGAASASDAARALSPVLPLREDRGPRLHQDFIEPWTSKNGAGALAFRRPTTASEVLASARPGPRFLEPPDATGRTLSGTSAASTSQSDTRRTGRCPSRP